MLFEPTVNEKGGLWFCPTRRGEWEVWHTTHTSEELVGVYPTRQEAYVGAQRYALEHGIPYKIEIEL